MPENENSNKHKRSKKEIMEKAFFCTCEKCDSSPPREVYFGDDIWSYDMLKAAADCLWVDQKFYPEIIRKVLEKMQGKKDIREVDLEKELPEDKCSDEYEELEKFFGNIIRIRELPSSHLLLLSNDHVNLSRVDSKWEDEEGSCDRTCLFSIIMRKYFDVLDEYDFGSLQKSLEDNLQVLLNNMEYEDIVWIKHTEIEKLIKKAKSDMDNVYHDLYNEANREFAETREFAKTLTKCMITNGEEGMDEETLKTANSCLQFSTRLANLCFTILCSADRIGLLSEKRPTKFTATYEAELKYFSMFSDTKAYFTTDVRYYLDLLHKEENHGREINRVELPTDCKDDKYFYFIEEPRLRQIIDIEFEGRKKDIYEFELDTHMIDDIPVPFVSPKKTLVLPAYSAFQKIVNFMLFKNRLFSRLREDCQDMYNCFIYHFIELLNVSLPGMHCLDWIATKAFLDTSAEKLAEYLENDTCRFFRPEVMYTSGKAYEIMQQLIKAYTLRRFHEVLKSNYNHRFSFLERKTGKYWTERLEELVIEALIVEHPDLAFFCHTQTDCYWSLTGVCFFEIHFPTNNRCCKHATKIPADKMTYDDLMRENEALHMKEDEEEPCTPKGKSTLQKKKRPSLDTKMLLREMSETKKEMEKPKVVKVVSSKVSSVSPQDLSTFFAYETTEKVETTRRCAKVVEKEEETKKLWNGHMVLKTLKYLLPEKIYKRISVMLTPKFHGQLTQKYYTYQDILHMIQKFEWNNYHNHDKLLDDFQQLRSIPGSAMFFDSVGVLDYFIDEEKEEKAYDLKQNWLKRFAIKNAIQTKWNKDVLDIIIGYELDKVAGGLGCCEVVKIEDYHKKFEKVYKKVEEQNDEGKKEEEQWMTTNRAQFDKMKDDKKLIEALIGFALNTEEYHTSHWLRNIIQHELETNEDRNIVIDHVHRDIYTARRTVAKLCELDEYGLTKKWKKEEMKDIPMVRCIKLKEKIVFTSEVRYSLEVAEQLNKFNMDMVDESLKMHGLTDNRVEVFDYVSIDELDDIATTNGLHQLPFELVHFEHPKLKTSHSYAPIISPNYTMCIPAFVVLEQVFNILSNELKIFYRLRRDSINELTRYIANLCYYLQPESQSTFCLDYKKVGELLDETRRLFNPLMDSSVEDIEDVDESIKPKEFKKILEKLAKSSVFRSFDIMLMVFADKAELSHTNLSRNNLDECVYNAGCRCLMYEYPEIAIAYHNQRMCQTNNKTQFCSISLIEDIEFRFDTPSRCAVGFSQSMAEFQKKNDSGRMEKVVLEESWIERMNKKMEDVENERKKEVEQEEVKKADEEVKTIELCPVDDENIVFQHLHQPKTTIIYEKPKKAKNQKRHEKTIHLFLDTDRKKKCVENNRKSNVKKLEVKKVKILKPVEKVEPKSVDKTCWKKVDEDEKGWSDSEGLARLSCSWTARSSEGYHMNGDDWEYFSEEENEDVKKLRRENEELKERYELLAAQKRDTELELLEAQRRLNQEQYDHAITRSKLDELVMKRRYF